MALSDTGSIVNPCLHDGFLTKIEILDDNEARLTVREETGGKFELILSGLVRLKASEFCEGNLILDVILHTGETCDAVLLGELYRVMSGQAFDSILRKVRERELSILEIQPSYGCTLLALCREVNCYKFSP